MRRISLSGSDANLRSRRWDAIVLGGALPGLVAATRLAAAGHRVLVVEENSATRSAFPLREPFFLPACETGGITDSCLKAVGIPLIDRRRLAPTGVAYQVLLPDARVDVGDPGLTAEELGAWDFAAPDQAKDLVAALSEAAIAEREAMLESRLVRIGGRRSAASKSGVVAAPHPMRHARGLPEVVSRATPPLSGLLEAQVRALSGLGESAPAPEARARLLGVALAGGATPDAPENTLRGLLCRRIKQLHGDFRSVRSGFEFIALGNDPGISVAGTSEIWLGRLLVLNAPLESLAAAARDTGKPPEFLSAPAPAVHRIAVHLRVESRILPEGMARRVILVGDPNRPLRGGNHVTLSVHPGRGATADVVARAIVDRHDARSSVAEGIEAALTELMPFSEGCWSRDPSEPPTWDSDEPLVDPRPGQSWPGDVELRLSSKPLVCQLPREAVAALGVEGDLLLGWRGGDALAEQLH